MKIKKIQVTFRGFVPETMEGVEHEFEMHVKADVDVLSPELRQKIEWDYFNWLLSNAYYPDWDGALSYKEK